VGDGVKKLTLRGREAVNGYLFILPWVIGLLLFFIAPMIESIRFSFAEVSISDSGFSVSINGIDNARNFWENYRYFLLADASFLEKLRTTALDTAAAVIVITVFSLFVAALLHGKFKGRNVYRAVFFLPVIMTTGVMYLLIQQGMSGGELYTSTSIVDSGNAFTFKVTSLRDIMLQGGLNADFVEAVTKLVNQIFNYVSKAGVQILLFLSGLAKIPASHYEAAKIEGANGWESFWKITFPIISPVIFLNTIYTMLDSFITYGMENSGNVTMYAIQQMGFGKVMRFDYAAAMSWIYTLMIIVFVLLAYLAVGLPSSKVTEGR
jgi:ABC-type sugar transport system permease subunit